MHSKRRTSVFTEGEKRELKDCIVDLADLDFAPTLQDIQKIVTMSRLKIMKKE